MKKGKYLKNVKYFIIKFFFEKTLNYIQLMANVCVFA